MNKQDLFFIYFDTERMQGVFKLCRIEEQFLSHSFNLIYTTFEKTFKSLKEAQAEFYKFSFIVGSSQQMFFKIIKGTKQDHEKILKDLEIKQEGLICMR